MYSEDELRRMLGDSRVDELCYYALWGYDGMGGIGPKEPYEMHEAKRKAALREAQPLASQPFQRNKKVSPFGARRNHRKGHGWKANHQY
jgi:hypothetical protein